MPPCRETLTPAILTQERTNSTRSFWGEGSRSLFCNLFLHYCPGAIWQKTPKQHCRFTLYLWGPHSIVTAEMIPPPPPEESVCAPLRTILLRQSILDLIDGSQERKPLDCPGEARGPALPLKGLGHGELGANGEQQGGNQVHIPSLQTKEVSAVQTDARHWEALPGTTVLISTLGAEVITCLLIG